MFPILDGKECFIQIPRESKGSGVFCRAYFGASQQHSARKSEAGSHCPLFLGQKLKVRNQSGEHIDSLVLINYESVHLAIAYVFTSAGVSQIPAHWAWHFSEGNCTWQSLQNIWWIHPLLFGPTSTTLIKVTTTSHLDDCKSPLLTSLLLRWPAHPLQSISPTVARTMLMKQNSDASHHTYTRV